MHVYGCVVGRKLFGESYSGLEYDYRGLKRLYENKMEYEKALEYDRILTRWHSLRRSEDVTQEERKPLEIDTHDSLHSILQDFFHGDEQQVS